MAKKLIDSGNPGYSEKYLDLVSHYSKWTEDNDQRRTRKYGWNDVTDSYWGKLPAKWPFTSKVVDPRIRTSVIEKDARLLNKKPKGKVIPRDSRADIVKAEVQNALLSFQWDKANYGGTMQEKLLVSSQDTRLYGSKYALIPWIDKKGDDGAVKFCGNEFIPLDIRDCGMDWAADHIRNAKWFQHRAWRFVEDLERENRDQGETIWKNLRKIKGDLRDKASKKSDRKDIEYSSRVLEIKGLTERVGTDNSFPMIEVVTEYREDRWISFAPQHGVILRDIPNPYNHGKIPVTQLRYYPIQDDPLGESEVEPVIPLWRAIQATVCGYLDEMILKMRPPLKIVENEVRMETIEYGPEAQWLMNRTDAVEEMRSNGESQRWFQTTYAALTSAFSTAMGDLSQNVSNVETFSGDKTATEIRQSVKQQNARDQRNQNELSDFITDTMSMWISNNKQFLINDPEKKYYILKVLGQDGYDKLQKMGLDAEETPKEAYSTIQNIIQMNGGKVSDAQLRQMTEDTRMPKHPVITNPNAQNPEDYNIQPKMKVDELGESAELYITEDDFDGEFDFIIDVKSMEMGSSAEYVQARQQALSLITNPNMLQLLMQEQVKPKIKGLLIDMLNQGGLNDSQKYFEQIPTVQDQGIAGANQGPGGPPPAGPNQGVQGLPTPDSQASLDQQMARS